jgi:MYXO-CTERM domain-containing protein
MHGMGRFGLRGRGRKLGRGGSVRGRGPARPAIALGVLVVALAAGVPCASASIGLVSFSRSVSGTGLDQSAQPPVQVPGSIAAPPLPALDPFAASLELGAPSKIVATQQSSIAFDPQLMIITASGTASGVGVPGLGQYAGLSELELVFEVTQKTPITLVGSVSSTFPAPPFARVSITGPDFGILYFSDFLTPTKKFDALAYMLPGVYTLKASALANSDNGATPIESSFSFTLTVPGPGTGAIGVLGLGVLAMRRRRRADPSYNQR